MDQDGPQNVVQVGLPQDWSSHKALDHGQQARWESDLAVRWT